MRLEDTLHYIYINGFKKLSHLRPYNEEEARQRRKATLGETARGM